MARRSRLYGLLLTLAAEALLIPASVSLSPPAQKAGLSPSNFSLSMTKSRSDSSASVPAPVMQATTIENFRQTLGMDNVYRCASTDPLGNAIPNRNDGCSPESTVFHTAGLVIDLRSPSERDEILAQKWMASASSLEPLAVVEDTVEEYLTKQADGYKRFVVRIDVLSPDRFMSYVTENWLSSSEKAKAAWFKLVDGAALHELRIEKLNDRGLAGLNEAILETGKDRLMAALEIITEHLERYPGDVIVFHCVQGKDRTGMLAMLLQSILGVDDDGILRDYIASNQMRKDGSAAANRTRRKGRLDRDKFSGTNVEAMLTTLSYLRTTYGSISSYLDDIGFNEARRSRLRAALMTRPTSKL